MPNHHADKKEARHFLAKPWSLAIPEDYDKVRHWLAEQIRLHIDIERLEAFSNAEDALQKHSANPVDVAMFDIELPGMNGIECIRRLKIIHPRMQVMATRSLHASCWRILKPNTILNKISVEIKNNKV